MLYIEFDYTGRQDGEPPLWPQRAGVTWHTGEPWIEKFQNRVHQVLSVQADGDELEWVLQHIKPSLPVRMIDRLDDDNVLTPGARVAPVQRWFGDQAKFIANVIFNS